MVVSPHFLVELFFLSSSLLFIKNREFSKEKEKAESRGDFQRLRQKKQMEEDLEGYMDWLTMAEEMGHVHSIQDGQKGLNVDVGKHKGDPVVMGLLKSTIFPLQQVLDGKEYYNSFKETEQQWRKSLWKIVQCKKKPEKFVLFFPKLYTFKKK